jgi:hypothetical protein
MDYRAAGAAAYLGLGAVWALGLSSSAAQLQANPASLPPSILSITGVIPFTETIFLWQSGVMLAALVVVSLVIAYATAPGRTVHAAPKTAVSTPVHRATRAATHPPGRVAGAQPDPDPAAGGPGRWLAVPGVRHQACDHRDLRAEHLQPAVHHARCLAALAPAQLSRRRGERCRPPPAC